MTETLFPVDVYAQAYKYSEDKKAKRRWEDHFQKWSDKQSEDGYQPYGNCGTGGLCDYCENNDYGRPCVRALNALCRERKIKLDYLDKKKKKIWFM